jgi:hypothetical protein
MTRGSTYRRTAIVAGVVAVAAVPLAAGVANASTTHAHPSRSHATTHGKPGKAGNGRGHASSVSKTLTTTTGDVNVRTEPNVSKASHVVTSLRRAGTAVDVSCYVTGQAISHDTTWYRVTKPATGYVSGHYLRTGHEPAAGVSRCASSTHH